MRHLQLVRGILWRSHQILARLPTSDTEQSNIANPINIFNWNIFHLSHEIFWGTIITQAEKKISLSCLKQMKSGGMFIFSVNICIHEPSFAIKDQDQISSSPNIIAIPSIILHIFNGVFSVSLISGDGQFYFHWLCLRKYSYNIW